MKTIVIEVSGGVVQDVYADDGTRVILVDWDEQEGPDVSKVAGEIKPWALRLMPEVAEQLIASQS